MLIVYGGVVFALCNTYPGVAQVVTDASLPVNTTVTISGNTNVISGGTQARTNLFHSFDSFSIPTGGTAAFNNAVEIQNIFSRVTGESVSNIDGLIQANGAANLFLLNPNGIIFGQNARLDIGGSFVGTTASSIKFADGTEFSATTPQTAPLLTINVPVGLQFGQNPGSIGVQGRGHSLKRDSQFSPFIGAGNSLTGLRVKPEKTLALVGGKVTLEGGILTTPGRIELGSVSAGQVNLNPVNDGWSLGYEAVQGFQSIQLHQKALLDASGTSSGSIQIQGQRLEVHDGSVILIQNTGSQSAESISVHTQELVEIRGLSVEPTLDSELANETTGIGNAGDIEVSTARLVLQDGGAITTKTYSPARGGNITVNASESVKIIGSLTNDRQTLSAIATQTFNSSGDAGDITVSSARLSSLNGGILASVSFSAGNGGDITIHATDFVELIGVNRTASVSSGFAASSTGSGNAGKLTINTSKLKLKDGAVVSASSLGSGNAGSVLVNASDSVEVSGITPGFVNPSLLISSAQFVSSDFQAMVGAPPRPSGASGNVTINTKKLSVTDNALVTVRNDGLGSAGILQVNADFVFLDNRGGITAATSSGNGGNINLQVRDLLLMRRNSSISATSSGTGNGGNINIDTPLLIAIPSENNDISANSENFRGGNVRINTQGIFGTQFRNFPTSASDITASGANSELSGTVEIETPEIDPSSGLTELPTIPIDRTKLIVQGCPANEGNTFTITGRGGLPSLPDEALRSNNPVAIDWVSLGESGVGSRESGVGRQGGQGGQGRQGGQGINYQLPISEAQSWRYDDRGNVILIATAPSGDRHSFLSHPTSCSD
ncbi:S-layer family protein [Chroococcidiopsis sp. FACHB-1243]|uniref:beta strand repeat-containing protein n=1 Tax=Chroococcidiopsis sp. [FACHB-1243] TaxID=2692781 RepID=UPI00177F3178|nr:S-layer family protein [Chroococcidiopsis sp. [FACHB-1243]]MBD2306480.1 S-layer family protein [Chroococcidiopsis sp. [FACHB-1243]]